MSSQLCQLLSKFRGCLIGGLIGDCIGSPFEGEFSVSKSVLLNYINKNLDENYKPFQVYPYTDDTAMTKSVAESLTTNKTFDAKDMAKRFTVEYIRSPKRGYGSNVIDVFAALKMTNYEQPYEPAKLQFGGRGSYGNGGAMRTAPIALFGYCLPQQQIIELARNCAQITHSNRNGYNGAILQCLAIHQALYIQVNDDYSIDVLQFLDGLIEKMEKIETEDNATDDEKNDNTNQIQTPYTDILRKMKTVFESKTEDLKAEDIVYLFGNNVSAFRSVPAAIYCVLRSQQPIPDYESDNPFLRTLYLTISLGGDTDTIACMALSIAGALYGHQIIPSILQRHCEDNEIILAHADSLYDLSSKL